MDRYRDVVRYVDEHERLPEGFNQWDLATDSGWTVAHFTATNGLLPKDFDQWDIVNDHGWTVAHEAANHGNLPEGFGRWDLKSYYGESLFEWILMRGRPFPEWFDDWNLVINDDGETCREVYERMKKQ